MTTVAAFSDQPRRLPLNHSIDMCLLAATPGEWLVPSITQQSLAIDLNSSLDPIPNNLVAICTRGQQRVFHLPVAMQFASFTVSNTLLERALEDAVGGRLPDIETGDRVEDSQLYALLLQLWREHATAYSTGPLFLDSLALALAASLLRHHSAAVFRTAVSRGGLGTTALRRCLEYIEDHLESEIRLVQLSQQAGVSVSHFSRAFHQSVGEAPYQYLLKRRIERAKLLMRDRRTSLTEVALGSGFADQHHLSRVFRRVMYISPSSYRRSL